MNVQYIENKIGVVLLCVAVFSTPGCTTTGGIQPIGKDTYSLGTTTYGGMKSWPTVKAEALKQANDFCEAKGMLMELVKDLDESGARGWTPMNVDATFKCVAK